MDEKFVITIGGIPDPVMFAEIVEVVVDTNVFLPTMCTVTIKDTLDSKTNTLKYCDKTKFKIGAALKVSLLSTSRLTHLPMPNPLFFDGEVTSVEPIFGRDGQPMMRVRGYDRAHRLMYGKKTRTFGFGLPKSTSLGEIFTQVLSAQGLAPALDPTLTSMRLDYVIQYNQSDWDFLWSLVLRQGYQLFVTNRMVNVMPAMAPRVTAPPGILMWGQNLTKFEPRIVAAGQSAGVEVIGWDYQTKKKIKMKAAPVKASALILAAAKFGNSVVKEFSSDKDAIIDPDVSDPAAAAAKAVNRFIRTESQFVRASGELSECDPFLLAGTVATVAGVGLRFSGAYHITQARHTWRSGRYTINFEVTGGNPYTFRHLINGDKEENNAGPKIDGVVIGQVTDLADPLQMGRVKVKFPWMPSSNGAELASAWARMAIIGGGKDRGIYFSPEMNDEVLVAFEHGNLNHPYIIGVLWNGKDHPPKGAKGPAVAGPIVQERVIRSKSGHLISLCDTPGQESITIIDKTGQNKVVINSVMNKMEINVQGDLSIKAMGKVSIEGQTGVDIKSTAQIGIEAQSTLSLKGTASTTLEATGSLSIKNAAASIALNGPSVNINNGALEVI
jgi:uncharacterized protein involved in type VI secretion and phage assembly